MTNKTELPPEMRMPGVPAPKKGTPFNFGAYLAEARKDEEDALLPPGRHTLTVADARVASEPNDKGLFYGVIACEAEGAEIPLILALDLSDDLKLPDGMPDASKLAADPIAKKQFLAGLAQLESLAKACAIPAEELANAESAEDAITSFIGCSFIAVIARGTDQYGLPANKIRKIVGPANG